MQLSQFSDYGIRMLLYLALKPTTPIAAKEIASAYGISLNHLRKIAQRLTALGYVTSTSGPKGGFQLARRPEAINLGHLICQLEPSFALVACFSPEGGGCVLTPCCRLKGILGEALQSFLATLENYTLADCLTMESEMRQVLGITASEVGGINH